MAKLNKIYSLMRAEKYSLALKELEKLENVPLLYPKVLVLKGICVFLAEDDNKYSYNDISKIYKKALSIDDENVSALLELGHHYFSSENKSELAIPLFDKAIRILQDELVDAIIGMAKCIEELKSPKKALKFLMNSKSKLLTTKKINDLIKEFSESE
jgi:tetratricopeptide (TPR) repeat protein